MQIGSRVVVTHDGDDSGSGSWVCSKDRVKACPHTKKAQDYLQKLLQADPEAMAGTYEPPIIGVAESREFHHDQARRKIAYVIQGQARLNALVFPSHTCLFCPLCGQSYLVILNSTLGQHL